MDSCGSSSNTTGLQRVAIKDLMPDMDNILVVALMIGKQRPRKFADKNKESSQFRAVWNFTLRDSPRDYINVTYWGGSDEVCAASDKFYTGDVGEQFCARFTEPIMIRIEFSRNKKPQDQHS
jgi:hypothetical protein